MEKKFKFSFIEQFPRLKYWLDTDNLEFYVFQRGKILPVAFIELTPYTVQVNNFRLTEAEMQDLKEEFKQFSGCSI